MATAQGIRAGRAYVELGASMDKLNRDLTQAQQRLNAWSSGARSAMISAFAIATPVALATKTFAEFDDQMRLVQAVTGATGAQFGKLTEQAKELGRTTSWTAAEAAQGMISLGRAGFKSDEIEASIAGVMDLARATGTEIGPATDIASNALRAFRLEASEMTRVVDVLTATANGSAQTLEDLGEAFKYVAPLAAETGLTIEDTAKIVGALANFGVRGSQAGTVLKAIQTRMASDSKAQELYLDLGIDITDAEGNLRKVNDVLLELGDRLRNVPSGERLAMIKTLFGQYGLTGVAITTANFRELNDAIDNADGTAARTAQTMDAGLGGAIRIMESAIEGAAIAIGESLVPTLTKGANTLEDAATRFTAFVQEHPNAITNVVKLTGSIGALSAGVWLTTKAMSAAVSVVKLGVSTYRGLSTAIGAVVGAQRAATAAEQARAATAAALTNVEKAVIAVNRATSDSAFAAANAQLALATAEYKSAAAAEASAVAKAKARAAMVAMTAATLAGVTALAAGAVVFVRYATSAERAAEKARDASDAARELADEATRQREMDTTLFEQLAELAGKQNLTNEEFARAQNIVAELNSRYGDLGLVADETARKIYGMADAQIAFNEAKRRQEKQGLQDQIATNEAEIERIQAAQDRMNQSWMTGMVGGARQALGGKSLIERQQEYNDRIAELTRDNRRMQMQVNAIDNESKAVLKDTRETAAKAAMTAGPKLPWTVPESVDQTERIEQALKPLESFGKLLPDKLPEPTAPPETFQHILANPLPETAAILMREFDSLSLRLAQRAYSSSGSFSAYDSINPTVSRQLDETIRQTRVMEDVREELRRQRYEEEGDPDVI
jgi:TP901 family phage tail tape measure protein